MSGDDWRRDLLVSGVPGRVRLPGHGARGRFFNAALAGWRWPVATLLLVGMQIGAFFLPAVWMRSRAGYGDGNAVAEWWRLAAGTFANSSGVLLVVGIVCMASIAWLVERLYGPTRYTAVYFICAMAANVVVMYRHPLMAQVTAVGGVAGICGAGSVWVALNWWLAGSNRTLRVAGGGMATLLIVLGVECRREGLDVAGLIAGLAAGALLGWGFAMTGLSFGRRVRGWGLAILPVAAGICVVAAIGVPTADDYRKEMLQFREVEGLTVQEHSEALASVQSGKMTNEEFSRVVEHDLLPKWKAERDHVSKLRLPSQQRALVAQITKYMSLRAEEWEMHKEGVLKNDRGLIKRAIEKRDAARAVVVEMRPEFLAAIGK